MIKFYKRALILLISSFIGLVSLQAQMPKFTMKTEKPVGQSFKFSLNYGPTVSVDWGDGVIIEYPSIGKPIEGQLKGATVSVSGHNISMIDCSDQMITELSINELAELQALLCSKNKLTELALNENSKLIKVNCSYNQISSLMVNKLFNLQELNFSYNRVSASPSFINNKLMKVLICNNNDLASLSVLFNNALKTLWCYSNNISTLTVTKATQLENLLCYDNNIKTLNITGLTSLRSLWCDHNKLSSLSLSTNTGLNYLSTDNNSLSSISFPSTFNVKNLYVNYNALGFSGLHSGNGITSYNYEEQYLIILPNTSFIEKNKELDLSTQLTTLDGIETHAIFNWFGDGKKLSEGVDYTANAGKFEFLKSFDKAYCEITSSLFPAIQKISTNTIGIASTVGFEENNNELLKIFIQNGRVIVKVPTEQTLRVFNMMGRLVKSIESVVGTVEIELPKGAYIINNKMIVL